jgi:hypothetical protein
MNPIVATDMTHTTATDTTPLFVLDDTFDPIATTDDWWLDLGCVDLPNAVAV